MSNTEGFFSLQFKQAISIPDKNEESNDYLLVSSCEGYSLAKGVFDQEGAFLYFCGWIAGEMKFYSPEDYDFWSILPTSATLKVNSL